VNYTLRERPCFRIRSSLFQHVFEERTNKSNRDAQLRGQVLYRVVLCLLFWSMSDDAFCTELVE
jgi:hypothetical protein